MFDEEEWVDDGNGKQLENTLFDGKKCSKLLQDIESPENVTAAFTTTTKKKRNKKRGRKVKGDKILPPSKATTNTELKIKIASRESCELTESAKKRKKSLPDLPVKRTKPNSYIEHKHEINTNMKSLCQVESVVTPKKYEPSSASSRSQKLQEQVTNKLQSAQFRFTNDSASSRSQKLRERVTNKLQSAQFRFTNEQLYSCHSKEAKRIFNNNPRAFADYHTGFTQQVSKWPVNPLDSIISFLRKRPSKWVIGDFGCGDARLAASIKNTVHSFDLVATNERITVADISKVPLPDCSLDVAVFCLSLMGTNFTDFLIEANRTLKLRGLLKIAEVASRFTSISKFVNILKKLGFELENKDTRNSHFFMFDYRKTKECRQHVEAPKGLLKPCLYKKR